MQSTLPLREHHQQHSITEQSSLTWASLREASLDPGKQITWSVGPEWIPAVLLTGSFLQLSKAKFLEVSCVQMVPEEEVTLCAQERCLIVRGTEKYIEV